MSRVVEEGFTLVSANVQRWYDAVRRRLVPNFDFDQQFLTDVERMLSNLGWGVFHQTLINYNTDIAMEFASTM